MAQFDLKLANIFLLDGFGPAGAINNVAGYTTTSTTMIVDNFTTQESAGIAVGDRFTVAALPDIYTITAITLTLGAITSITFTPGLVTAGVDDDIIQILNHELKIKVGEGNLTTSEKKARQYIKDRGLLDTVRNADEEPLDVKLDFQWEFVTNNGVSGALPTPVDAIKQIGPASNWVTSDTNDPCAPYAVTVKILYSPICPGVKKELILLEHFRYEDLAFDLKTGVIAVTGKCNVKEMVVSRIT